MAGRRGLLAVLLVMVMVTVSFAPIATTVVAEIDSDGDGFSDKYERQEGTDPEDPDDYPGKDPPITPPPKPEWPEIDRYEIDVLPSRRIIPDRETISAAIYVRKDATLVDGKDVYFKVYIKTGSVLKVVDEQESVLVNGRASFQFKPYNVGIYYLVSCMDPKEAGMSSSMTPGSIQRLSTQGQCGYAIIAVYQKHLVTIEADFPHLIPGMKARMTVRFYELYTEGLSEAIIDKHMDSVNPMGAMELYKRIPGKTYVDVDGPAAFSESRMIECGPNGGLWELSLGGIGTYTFRASTNEEFSGALDIEIVTVHNPKVLDIAIMGKYKLFDRGMLQVDSREVDPDISRELFNELIDDVKGSIDRFVDSYPEHTLPIKGKIYYSMLYISHNHAIVLEEDDLQYNGFGYHSYHFDVPGQYHIYVDDEPLVFPDGSFYYSQNYAHMSMYNRRIDIVTDYRLTTFPNKQLYFSNEDIKLTTAFMSDQEVVRDVPVAVFVDGTYHGNASAEAGDFVIQHQLGKMEQGYHTVRTFPLTSDRAFLVLDAFGIEDFVTPWVGYASFAVKGIGIYLDIPTEAVRGRIVSFRIVALDAPMDPCDGCTYTVDIKNGMTGTEVAKGVTDHAGTALVEFEYPDIYSQLIHITVSKGETTSYITRNLDPRAQTLDGIAVTNKPIYKAGETVMVRFLVWNADLLEPSSGDLDVKVTDPADREVLREKVVLDEMGSGALQIPIGIDKKNGDYP